MWVQVGSGRMRPLVVPDFALDGPAPPLSEEERDDCRETLRRFPKDFLQLQAHCVAINAKDRPTFEDVRDERCLLK